MALFRKSRSYSLYRHDRSRKRLWRAVRIALQLFLVYVLVTGLFVRTYVVESVSMHPTLRPGERILATPLSYGPRLPLGLRLPGIGEPQRGDLVLVEPPFHQRANLFLRMIDPPAAFLSRQNYRPAAGASAADARSLVLKRIVALPGDTVRFTDHTAYVRPAGAAAYLPEGALNVRRSYQINIQQGPAFHLSGDPFGGNIEERTLEANEYFVVGDNRTASLDSRHWGAVSGSALHSRVIGRYFPLSGIGRP